MRTRLAVFALSLATLTSAAAQSRNAKTFWHLMFVSVTDASGAPVPDVRPDEFNITEGGAKRMVVRAGLSTDPMRVALFLDTSDAMTTALTALRLGTLAFLDALPPEHEVLLISTGRQVRVRVPPTTDRKKLKDAANSLFADGAGTVLMDGLLEIDDRFMRKAANRWPVFVVVTSDGTESSAGAHEKEFNDWTLGLAQRGVSGHALVVKGKGSGVPEMMAMNVTTNAGGRYDMMNTTTGLPEKMKTLATQIAGDYDQMRSWYVVEFQTDARELRPIEVAVPRGGVKIKSSYRRSGQ